MKKLIILIILVFNVSVFAEESGPSKTPVAAMHNLYFDAGIFVHDKKILKGYFNEKGLERGASFAASAVLKPVRVIGVEPFFSYNMSSDGDRHKDVIPDNESLVNYDYSLARVGINGHIIIPVSSVKIYGFGGVSYNFISMKRTEKFHDGRVQKIYYEIDNNVGFSFGGGIDYMIDKFSLGLKYEKFINKPDVHYTNNTKEEIDLSGYAVTLRVGYAFTF